MKSPKTTLKIAATILAVGTGYEAYNIAHRFFGSGLVGVFCSLVAATAAIALFDNAGVESFIRVGKHFAQRRRATPSIGIIAIVGAMAFFGSIWFSLSSVPLISRQVAGDTDADNRIAAVIAAAKEGRQKHLQAIEKAIRETEADLAEAKKKLRTARTDAIRAQGGEYARLALGGNQWVHTAPAFKSQRRAVEKAVAAANENVEQLSAILLDLKEQRAKALQSSETYDAGTASYIQTQMQRFQTWNSIAVAGYTATNLVVICCAVLVILSIVVMAIDGNVEDITTISEMLASLLEKAHDGIVALPGLLQGIAKRNKFSFGARHYNQPLQQHRGDTESGGISYQPIGFQRRDKGDTRDTIRTRDTGDTRDTLFWGGTTRGDTVSSRDTNTAVCISACGDTNLAGDTAPKGDTKQGYTPKGGDTSRPPRRSPEQTKELKRLQSHVRTYRRRGHKDTPKMQEWISKINLLKNSR